MLSRVSRAYGLVASLVRSTIAIDCYDDARLPLSPVAVLLCSMPAAGLDIHSLPFVGLLQQISVVLTAAVMPLASGHSHGHATAAAWLRLFGSRHSAAIRELSVDEV